MATIDIFNEFCDAVSIAAGAGTANIGNTIDTAVVAANQAQGLPLWLVISVSVAIVTGGSAGTLQFRLVSDDSTAPSTTTCSTHLYTPVFATDDDPVIPAGVYLFQCPLPVCRDFVSQSAAGVNVLTGQGAPYERYLGLQAIIGTTTITAGSVDAFLTPSPRSMKPLPDAAN